MALFIYLAGLPKPTREIIVPKGWLMVAIEPLAVVPAVVFSGRNSRALIRYLQHTAFLDPLSRANFHPVIATGELGQVRTHWFYPYFIASRGCGYLQHFAEIVLGPDPGAFCEQFVVDIDAIDGWQSFPFAVEIKPGFDEYCVHTVFIGGW